MVTSDGFSNASLDWNRLKYWKYRVPSPRKRSGLASRTKEVVNRLTGIPLRSPSHILPHIALFIQNGNLMQSREASSRMIISLTQYSNFFRA